MIQLSSEEHETLCRIVRAGAVEMGGACRMSTALRLQLAGFVSITASVPQMVEATSVGAAHVRRSAA